MSARVPRNCVLRCPGNTHKHNFPKDEISRNVWLKQLGIKHAKPSSYVCDLHFSDKMRQGSLGVKLTPWAIPDINLPKQREENYDVEDMEDVDDVEDVVEEDEDYIEHDSAATLNGYSTTYVPAENNPKEDEPIDFDDLLAKVHCISDLPKNNGNNVATIDEDEESADLLDDEDEMDFIEDRPTHMRNSANDLIGRDFDEDTISAPSTPVEINGKFKRKLIASVRKRRILYDSAHPSFSNIGKKTRAWERIGKIQKLNGTACRELWLNIRYDYQNHVRSLRQWLAGESYQRDRPRIPFENDLLFLWRYIPDKSHCEDSEEENSMHPRSVICHIPGVPDASTLRTKDVAVVANAHARAVDHPYANNKTDESIQFASNLIEVVRYYPELYDPLHPNYGDAKRKSIIWDAASNELGQKATKCLFTWLLLQLRYEFEVTHGKFSYLVNKMDFLKKYILTNEKSPYKRTTLVSEQWFEPMNTSKEQHLIIQTIISMKRYRPFFANFDSSAGNNREIQTPCWIAVARSLKRKAQQCEITWTVMQAMYSELIELRRKGFPLRDEWEFESVITDLLENISKKNKKYGRDLPPVNRPNLNSELCVDEESGEPSDLPESTSNEITFTIPGPPTEDNPTGDQLVRFNLNTPVKDLPEKTIVEIDSVLPNALLVLVARYRKAPTIYLFTVEKRKELVAEVMGRPILFNEPCKLSRLARIFWGEISVEMGYPVEICMYFWEYILERSLYVDYDPAFKKSKEEKWIRPPNPIFDKFQKYADLKEWSEYIAVLPEFIQEISNFPLIYVDLKINSTWNRRQCHTRDITEVWTILARKFAVLENHKVIWDKFKQVFLQYMTEMEISIYNPWPAFWAPVLAKLKFLHELRYDPKDPIYYVIKIKIEDEIKQSKRDGKSTFPTLDAATNAKAIFRLLKENEYLEDFTWVNRARFVAKLKSFPMLYNVSHPLFGNKNSKLDAWQEMALSFHCTVGECHLIFQHLMKSFLLFRARDPNQVCRVNAKYWENMTYIYSCAVPNAIDPKSMEGRSFRANSNGSTIKLAEEYQAEISLVDAKPRLILKNFAAAVNSLPIQIQTSVVQQIKYIFAEYTRIQGEEIVVDV